MSEIVKSGPLVLEYDLSSGTFGIRDMEKERSIFAAACAAAVFTREGRRLCTRDADSRTASADAGDLIVTHNFKDLPHALELNIKPIEESHGFILKLSIKNNGATELHGIDFYPLSLDCKNGASLFGQDMDHDYRFLRNGFLTWSGSEVRRWDETLRRTLHPLIHDMVHNPTVPIPRTRGHFIGEMYGAVHDIKTEATLITGFITISDQLSQIDFKSREGKFHHLKAVSHGEKSPVPACDYLSSEELLIIAVQPSQTEPAPHDAPLKSYAQLAVKSSPTPVCSKFQTPPVGWCSWYYYYERLDENVILENLEAAKSLSDRIPIEVFQVDDGYQPAPGDWLKHNRRFPHGLEWLSKKIRHSGFTPGLWLAPFFATHRSELFRRHRDWFVRREGGGPRPVGIWPQPASLGIKYGLDTTNPDVHNWLHGIFNTIVHEWGYEYLKLDFMYAGAAEGERYDPHATRAQAFRRGLEAIREASGDDTYIVGCGIPIALGLGIVNGMRVTGDTAPRWHDPIQSLLGHPGTPCVPGTAQVNFTRYFYNKLWGFNDPDCLMCRFEDTELSKDETLTHAAIVALSGGPLFISDDLSKLGPGSIRLAQRLIPPLETSAVPVDLFESPIPATLVKKFGRAFDPLTIVGRFNWSDSATDLPVLFSKVGLDDNTDYHVYDLQHDHYHGIHRGRVMMTRVPKHASRVLSIRPVSRTPQLVATTLHFTQGGVDLAGQEYNANARQLKLFFRIPCLRDARIYIHCPEGYDPRTCVIRGSRESHETVLKHIIGRLFRLDFVIEDSAELTVEF
jgi:alpha-galactosidase